MLSIPHLIVIFVVALVVFGPEKLPELARGLGKVMAEFRRHTNDLRSTFEGHLRDLEREADARRISAPSASVSAPPTPTQNSAQPTTPSPGAVPSQPSNVGSRPNAAPSADSQVNSANRKHPGDDPYLADLTSGEFAPVDLGEPEQSESRKVPERVPDGDVRPT
jgi:TatA/E family protein of Tat protein translocase